MACLPASPASRPGQRRARRCLERPKQAQYGDYASNVALQLAKALKRNPREIAPGSVAALDPSPWVARAELQAPGFINLFLVGTPRVKPS